MMAIHTEPTIPIPSGKGRSSVVGRGIAVILMALAMVVVAYVLSMGQTAADTPPMIDAARRAAVVDSVATLLQTRYVFPEMGEKMARMLRRNLKKKEYDGITDPNALAQSLREDLIAISNDLHLGVTFSPGEVVSMRTESGEDSTEAANERLRYLAYARADNFGFREVKRLPGNIGYIKFNGFSGLPEATEAAGPALDFVKNCDALVFDVRQNGGGSPAMIQFISSHLFDGARHLNTFYLRETDSLELFHTYPHILGGRLSEIPIYVLTSSRTFSAAEEFTYNLKHMKRATIVGDTTGGGAHPVDMFPVDDGFLAKISIGRAINPITGTNWEGVGVIPDIAVAQENALDAALVDAMQTLIVGGVDEERAHMLQWQISGLDAKVNPVMLGDSELQRFTGAFGPRMITVEDGTLVYQRGDRPKYAMIPMGDDLFCFANLDYFRLRFERDDDGIVTSVVGLYENGFTDRHERGQANP